MRPDTDCHVNIHKLQELLRDYYVFNRTFANSEEVDMVMLSDGVYFGKSVRPHSQAGTKRMSLPASLADIPPRAIDGMASFCCILLKN
jgi:hypothetical protein